MYLYLVFLVCPYTYYMAVKTRLNELCQDFLFVQKTGYSLLVRPRRTALADVNFNNRNAREDVVLA